jgi:ABC-type multidrug transport system ATPase subunit
MSMELAGVGKRWSRSRPWILRDVDLELAPGSMTVLTGANGSGKSTLLRIVAGLTGPTRGRIRARPRHIAVVPDRFRPPARMSAAAYLNNLGRMRGLSCWEAERRSKELSELLALTASMEAPIEELSKGSAQRVLLAQAFLVPVDLLVLDEPGTALDGAGRARLEQLIAEACGAGAAVIVSDPARSVAGSLRIDNGRLERVQDVSGGGVVVVDLVARHESCDPTRLEPGLVRSVDRPAADRVRVTVDAAHSDQLLAAALQAGWSVRELRSPESRP